MNMQLGLSDRKTIADSMNVHPHSYTGFSELKAAYAQGLDPAVYLREIYESIARAGERPVWIRLVPLEEALNLLQDASLRQKKGESLPLFGIPFAIKDNIDVAGVPTTAGCPEYAYMPERHATVVARLIAAGAIPIGKTNLDQFATGLNGTRSPHGSPRCVFDNRYISGGSSSGSAVAVASGLVCFSLGTDTAGSGRVPASFNNIVGLKPTKGLLSSSGVVPAVRSVDCVSVFAATVEDALEVTRIASGYDETDSYSRQAPENTFAPKPWQPGFRFGVPEEKYLDFLGDEQAEHLYKAAVSRLESLGGIRTCFDYKPFSEAASLLYAGPWLAERLAAIKVFAKTSPGAIHPVVRDIIHAAEKMTAVDAFEGQYRLAELVRNAETEWQHIDVMLLPTAPTIYTVEAMLSDPIRLNSNLGLYTNFVNLMDLSAIAVPAGFRPDGLPFGISLIGRSFEDGAIASLADKMHKSLLADEKLAKPSHPITRTSPDTIGIAVVGAHLAGQPLNSQLRERGGKLRRATRTATGYALYALNDSVPPKPGLIRDTQARGLIEVEIWDLPPEGFGTFVNEVPAPLSIGTVKLEDGSTVKGFLCEPYAIAGTPDITNYGGWKAYRASLS